MAKIEEADVHSLMITARLEDTKERKLFRLKNKDPAKIAVALKNKIVEIEVENNIVGDIARNIEVTIYGAKYDDIIYILPRDAKRLRFPLDLGELLFFEIEEAIIFVFLLMAIFIYLILILPIVYLIASIITLGEAWRMRHKTRLNIPIRLDTLTSINKLVKRVVEKNGFVRGISDVLIDKKIAEMNNRFRRPYLLLDLGKYMIGLVVVMVCCLYGVYILTNQTFSGFLAYLISTDFWIFPAIISCLGLIMIIVAGIYHRRVSHKEK